MIRVLIVEDDPMVSELNRCYLERIEGFQLAGICRDGEEALHFLRENKVDLVLLDVFMPGMNGLELLHKVRREGHGVDVILVTAAREQRSIQEALRQGAIDYLIKPFQFLRFQTALLDFKKRQEWLRREVPVNQGELDRLLQRGSRVTEEGGELPKGLDRNTMKRIWEAICQVDGEFTAEEMAKLVGISQVSIRKYLKYLQQLELLLFEIHYGSFGRPLYRYRQNAEATVPSFLV